ncbi:MULTISPECIES: ABC transporter substrate-binding protein [Metallosphaera]|uniref:ABC transporter substrate-binding protein n=1 Tax=Metallosphaera TaxID=41980 RepID=UPI001F057395|nr:ABC transporter substrate-binding protein [Metallosphaera sedula]MCH1770335.1 ABC transporter substrate-binding protein [Metallosphaera sedula]MCP6727831.1 ABC transporter substrate-binding protein [Metallosphaera sedula]
MKSNMRKVIPLLPRVNYKKSVRGIAKSVVIGIVIVIIVISAVAVIELTSHRTTPPSVTNTSTTTTTPPPVTGNVTITYFDDLSQSEASVMQNVIIPQFEKEYPNIHINYVDEGATDIVKSVEELELSGNVGPVIIGEDNLVIGELLNGNYLMNLTPYTSEILQNVSLIPSMVSLVKYEQSVYHGEFFIPLRGNIPLVWYNATLFQEMGITPPQNWSQLMQVASEIKAKTGVAPIMFQGHGGASTYTELYQWMVQAGGNPFLFNDSGDVLAFEYLYNLSNYFTPGYVHGYWGSYKGLLSGEYYMIDYQWPYIYSTMASEGVNMSHIGFYPGPTGPANGDHLVGGDVLAIPKGATDIPALIDFARFLLSTQVQRDFIIYLSWPAVNQQAYNNLPSNISTLYKAEEEAMSNAFFREPVPWITVWGQIADKVFDTIIVDHAPYSQIPSILSQANQEMYNYLVQNYNTTVAQQYEQGVYGPLYG